MTVKPCLDCGKNSTNGSRCPECERAYKAARERTRFRGTRQERGLDAEHERLVKLCIARQPWFSVCGHRGSPDNPLTGDHIKPRDAGGLIVVGGDIVTQCCRCGAWKTIDGYRGAGPLRTRVGNYRVSHGLCPDCYEAEMVRIRRTAR